MRQIIIGPMHQTHDLDVFERFMSASLDPESDINGKFGCLFLNTTVENAELKNSDIRKITDACFSELLSALTGVVKRAKANGTVRKEVGCKGVAEFVKGIIMAAAIINRDADDVSALKGLINMAFDTVDSWRT